VDHSYLIVYDPYQIWTYTSISFSRYSKCIFHDYINYVRNNIDSSKNKISSFRVSLLPKETNEYLRDQLVQVTEQFSSITLRSTDRTMREIYTQSLNTFIIEKRNLTELVNEMANYTNLAIMKKLEAIRNLVNISEQSYRRFAETDETTRNATAKFMSVSFSLLFEVHKKSNFFCRKMVISVQNIRRILL
jgi:hypothetical protein